MWNPYLAIVAAHRRARGFAHSARVPMGAPSGVIAGYAPNPAYQQAYFQAPRHQSGPSAGVGIAGGALSQAEIQRARDLSCRIGFYLNAHFTHVEVGHVAALVAMCFPDSKSAQIKQLVAAHYFAWCIASPGTGHGPPVG